jgi:hypothetical protein
MHIHFIPAKVDLGSLLPFGQQVDIASWSDVVELGAETDGYVVVGGSVGNLSFMPISGSLPPHYLRTKISETLAVPERADWQLFADSSNAAELTRETRVAASDIVAGLTVEDST